MKDEDIKVKDAEIPVINAADQENSLEENMQSQPDPLILLQQALDQAKEAESAERDKALRALAELENFKKRKQNEVDSFKLFAAEKVIFSLLPILDSLELALQTTSSAQQEVEEYKKLSEGFSLIHKQLKTVLEKEGVQEMDVIGKQMDPNHHQAISMQESTEIPSGHIIQCLQKGYFLHHRVLRPAMVIVSQ
jgi:molecular chaperone GrpE